MTKNLMFGVLVAGALAACNQNKTTDKPAASTPAQNAATVSNKPEIVFVNEDTLTTKYQAAIDMQKRLEDKGKAAQADVTSRQQALQRDYVETQKKAATMTQDQQKTEGERLQRAGQSFQQYQQNTGAELQDAQQKESKKLYDDIYAFTKQYAKDNGYKMVLTFQTGKTQLLYADPSLDVTADFLKKINDAYGKNKK